MANVRFGVDFGDEWQRAQEALTIATKTINPRMAETMRKVSLEAIARVKADALAIPVHGKKHRGTRARLAAGVGSKRTRRGRRITTSMPRGEEALPRGFESQWHHPVFGRGMVTQAPQTDWFIEPIAHFGVPLGHAFERDLENMARDIKRMTEGH